MAGDWIKMTHALPEKPEVLAIAGKTGLSRFEVVGRLFVMWRWFDINTLNGNAASVTSVTLDACLFGYGCVTNFVSAVVECGWLQETPTGLDVVNFETHISESAKHRAQTAIRVSNHKSREKSNAASVTSALANPYPSVSKSVPREEKRREEKEHPKPLEGFTRFWDSWPKSNRKGGKAECEKLWRKDNLEAVAGEIVAHVESMSITDNWTKQGGEFVPAPAVYLRGKRWDGADAAPGRSSAFEGAI